MSHVATVSAVNRGGGDPDNAILVSIAIDVDAGDSVLEHRLTRTGLPSNTPSGALAT